MIQRIQSIYLLLISILTSLLFFLPYQSNVIALSEIKNIQLSFLNADNELLFVASVFGIVIIAEAIVVIFLYKNRKLQMMLCHYLSLLNIILLTLMYLGASQINGLPIYKLPYIIPVLNIILSQLARYFIKKDEELVKSANRIR